MKKEAHERNKTLLYSPLSIDPTVITKVAGPSSESKNFPYKLCLKIQPSINYKRGRKNFILKLHETEDNNSHRLTIRENRNRNN